jgi:uncharacterized membrane protein
MNIFALSSLFATGPFAERPPFLARFFLDPIGNSLAVITLVLMLISVILIAMLFISERRLRQSLPVWVIPVLSLLGLGVACYLSFVEVTKTPAFCGPIGNCNSVQKSPYAFLFGFLPVGIFGVMGYVAILATWFGNLFGPQSWRKSIPLIMWAMIWFGVLFSIYLTYLEAFVIGATCAWCISQAWLMTLLLWFTTPAAKRAYETVTGDEGE